MISDHFFTRIEAQYLNALPFVVYRKPTQAQVRVLLQKNNVKYTTKSFTESGFVFSPFQNNTDSILIPFSESECFNFTVAPKTENNTTYNNFNTDNETLKNQHIQLVKKGIEAIKKNELKKVVLSRKETISITEPNPIVLFKRLLKKYATAFVYCWYHPKVGLWLGATPETLIKIEGKNLSVMALAGTQNYTGALAINWQDKEIQEQKFVTDFIVEQITPLVSGLKITPTETVKAGNLLHLKNNIASRLASGVSVKDIVAALHPTPAVCGYPKMEAQNFILKHEAYKRTYYSGFLGELNLEITKTPRSGKRNIENRAYAIPQKSTQLYVNLRCMQIDKGQAIIYVGGGITKDSNATAEWQETVAKSCVIKSVL